MCRQTRRSGCWSEFIKDFGIGSCGVRGPAPHHPATFLFGGAVGHRRLKSNAKRERKTNRRVPSAYHGLSGTKREWLISKGFLRCGVVHGFNQNRTRIPLKLLAIPAGFEPATHGVEIRYSDFAI